MKKKTIAITFLLVLLIANISLASYSTVTMSVVEEPICTINLGQNSKFEKQLISKDLTNKEVTIELKVTNEEVATIPTGEIMLVLDNSNSMTTELGETTRKEIIFESAKTLVNKLLENNSQLKIGIVSFSTNTEQSKEGTIEDATLETSLTSDKTTLTTAISNIETNGARTNLQSGLLLASQQFSNEAANKYMIILTDGVPNVAINYDNIYYSDDVINKTKQQLLDLEDNGIHITTMLTGIDDENYVPVTVTKNFGQIITEVFGTEKNPTAGNFYYVTDTEVENTITTEIYNSLILTNTSLKNIAVIDYFPAEIVDNFEFAYVTEANIGEISTTIDKTNNSITWTIPEFETGKTAVVQYKLKLKEDFDTSIIDKIIDTNEKVDITYTDLTGNEIDKTSDVTPKLRLTEPAVEELPKELPKAGSPLIIVFAIIAFGILVFSFTKMALLNRKMK